MLKGLEASWDSSFSMYSQDQRSSTTGLTSDQRNTQETTEACLTMIRREGTASHPQIQLLSKTSVPVLIHHLDMFPNYQTPPFSLEI